LANIETDRARI
jgi:hypothetical protein